MPMTPQQKQATKEVIKNSLQDKFRDYAPETKHMPFHTRLLGKDRMALFSFIHSLNTNFGTRIFEPVAVELARNEFVATAKQATPPKIISSQAQVVIQKIMDDLSIAQEKPAKNEELERIRAVCQKGEVREVKLTKIDIELRDSDNNIFWIDLKTVKPNKGSFKEYKRTLLEWAAVALYENPDAKIHTLIAIPYNPYEPKPYDRWTMAGMLDLEAELKVAEELWDFVGGQDTYQDLLDCFEQVGMAMRTEIDDYFKNF